MFCTQRSFLPGLWGAFGMLGIKPKLAIYKANVLLTELSLLPPSLLKNIG